MQLLSERCVVVYGLCESVQYLQVRLSRHKGAGERQRMTP